MPPVCRCHGVSWQIASVSTNSFPNLSIQRTAHDPAMSQSRHDQVSMVAGSRVKKVPCWLREVRPQQTFRTSRMAFAAPINAPTHSGGDDSESRDTLKCCLHHRYMSFRHLTCLVGSDIQLQLSHESGRKSIRRRYWPIRSHQWRRGAFILYFSSTPRTNTRMPSRSRSLPCVLLGGCQLIVGRSCRKRQPQI